MVSKILQRKEKREREKKLHEKTESEAERRKTTFKWILIELLSQMVQNMCVKCIHDLFLLWKQNRTH